MSAISPKADMDQHARNVRFVPKKRKYAAANVRFVAKSRHSALRQMSLLDDLVGASEKRRRHLDAKGLGGLEVDYEFVFGGS